MIYLLITLAGVMLIFAGLWSMSFGFSTPPNFLLFLMGLVGFVLGVMIVILFAGKIDLESLTAPKPKKMRSTKDKTKMRMSPEGVKKAAAPDRKPRVRRPVKPVKTKDVPVKKEKIPKEKVKKAKPEINKPVKAEKTQKEAEKKPSKSRKFFKLPKRDKKEKTEKVTSESSAPIAAAGKDAEDKKAERSASKVAKPMTPRRVRKEPSKVESDKEKEPTTQDSVKKPAKDMKVIKPVKKLDKSDKHYVKDRLNKLKQEYIENVDDVEDLLEERMDSFKGALDQIRSESRAPSIIWSFDATDVQEAMKETILSADNKIIMMYPWIRNVDVGILKKFMDVESRMIIQEASLDDDASVELIKVLTENNVKIRTMPHIHTVAVVSDKNHGLIISTDPIYESYEVGVIYKDDKSISEIEKLFEEAWGLSRDIDLGETS
jgi:hypothetical protein